MMKKLPIPILIIFEELFMQFVFDGKFYKAIKITGPAHNMLGLALEEIKNHEIEIISLGSRMIAENNINELDVKNQVLSGIETINNEFGLKYFIAKIQFIPSDTPSESVYTELTIEIIRRLITGGKFTQI